MRDRPLTATYRLQMRAEFALDAARAIVPYLDRLGVSHIYTSPVLMARPGSTHGYDVADPTRLNPELGDDAARRALVGALRERRMGWVLDIVPNHMGTGPANPFWEDVLARGRRSRWAHWFDIDWDDRPQRLRGRILLPILGDDLDAVLERGELRLVRQGDAWRIAYFENSFPVSEESLELLGPGAGGRESGDDARDPDPGSPTPDPALLRQLLDRQHYQLAHWRRAAREINYRRFFDVNELAALRVEDPRVFGETHALALRWVGDGELDGLRIDHVDGLVDPLRYLRRLRAAVEERAGAAGPGVGGPGSGDDASDPDPRSPVPDPRSFPIVVEKILSPGERLRDEWPVQGTTGYEVLNDLEAALIDADGYERLEAHYRRLLRLRRSRVTFAEVARRGKLFILRGALRADVLRLARQLAPIARADAAAASLPREALVEGITQLVTGLPVYRTYIDGNPPAEPHPDDRAWLETAFRRARARGGAAHAALDFLERVLLTPIALPGDDATRARLRWIERFQQTTGPATAKGIEDTALYIYIPLASRNEVGGDPERDLRDAVETLHRANAERAERWPHSLVATNTHDTKRSADVRARLDVLSELPEEWAARVLRWRRLNARHRRKVKGRLEPDANTEYLLYQSLVGIWEGIGDRGSGVGAEGGGIAATPHRGDSSDRAPDPRPRTPDPIVSIRDRLEAYILKAAREGKTRTSWTDRNAEFEEAVVAFLHAVLDDPGSPFLADLDRFVARIARPGLWNALARVALHLTAPGIPDLYQGDELWSLALVDPDNRRPVDYALRERMLAALDDAWEANGSPDGRAALLRELVAAPEDGRIKMWVTSRLLRARRDDAALWRAGRYLPLRAEGALARHVVAWARAHEGRAAVVVAPRLTLGVTPDGAPPVGEAWGDTRLLLPAELGGTRWTCALAGHKLNAGSAGDALPLGDVLRMLPVALLRPAGSGAAR